MDERSEKDKEMMEEDINILLERLKFSEEESTKVFRSNDESNSKGFDVWAVSKIMALEKPNREAMYRVFKSLWFTKEEVNFVAMKEEVIIVKFGCLEDRSRILNLIPWLFDNCLFSMVPFVKGKDIDSYDFYKSPFWIRIFNVPMELMDRQTAFDMGKDLGELVAIDWKDKNGGWTEFIRAVIAPLNQGRVNWRNRVEVISTRDITIENREESKTDSREDSGQLVGKERNRGEEEEIMSTSPVERKFHRTKREGIGHFKSKRKRLRGPNGESVDESPAKLAKRRLLECNSPSNAVVVDQPRQEP
ncbi:Zinc finger, CCHC-type [Gossypium australe]|uniref:Zinc finger, CCHC-type n=1 Tax=Gossypium australe TaxID=47621 RepID=A0A5B6WVF3_9ROSI|nr:Zinc finger, CCHC-type [Gossypium australe]